MTRTINYNGILGSYLSSRVILKACPSPTFHPSQTTNSNRPSCPRFDIIEYLKIVSKNYRSWCRITGNQRRDQKHCQNTAEWSSRSHFAVCDKDLWFIVSNWIDLPEIELCKRRIRCIMHIRTNFRHTRR